MKVTRPAAQPRRRPRALPAPPDVRLRRMLDQFPAAVWLCGPDGAITYSNHHAAGLWGSGPGTGEPAGSFCGAGRLYTPDGELLPEEDCVTARAVRENRAIQGGEVVVERPDGTRVTVLACASPLQGEGGRMAGAVGLMLDISARKAAEDALERAERSKDEFLATLGHELRNPLAPIRNAVAVLRLQPDPTPEAARALEVIERQAGHMARLVDGLLDLARLVGPGLALSRDRVLLSDVVRAALATGRPAVEAHGHELRVDLPREDVPLRADAARLAQVLGHLLENAARHTPRGGRIRLEARCENGSAVVRVVDNGVGLAPGSLGRIFEPFAPRAGASFPGLGIGLSLARRIAELHGGSIEARSAGPGLGSEFVVRLPVLEESPAPGRPAGAAGAARALRVLVVDDNEDAALTLAMMLRALGHDVRTAGSGEEALRVAEELRPEIALLDLGLPNMSGYDLARRIRAERWGETMVLAATTGWGQDEDRRRSSEAGFDHHLVKPLDPADLRALLAAVDPVPAATTRREPPPGPATRVPPPAA